MHTKKLRSELRLQLSNSLTNPIRAARLKTDITQEALARSLGISAAALSKQEQENHIPRLSTVYRALRKLDELKTQDAV